MIEAFGQESALVEALRRREQTAYNHAVRLYSSAMLATARTLVDAAMAEDIVQETWVAVVDAIDVFEGRSALKTWLCTITANRARNWLRKTRCETLTDFQAPLEADMAARFKPNGSWAQPTSRWTSETLEQLLENECLAQCLDKHIAALPQNQQAVLVMREMQQMKTEDVCRVLDLSPTNLRVALHRARQRLFTMIEGYRETGTC